MSLPRLKQLIAALIFLSTSGLACAQYVWIDEKGIKQYSDQPPPASVPQSRILKTSGTNGTSQVVSDNASHAPSLADKNADFLKRRTEQAEKEKKASEDAKLASAKAQNCERARDYQRTLDSGQRIATLDKNGERTYMTDEQRARESRETQRVLSECK